MNENSPITTDQSLQILLVEDDADDAELIMLALQDAGFDAEFTRVESASEMAAALEQTHFQAILSDYALPGFGGREALEMIQARSLDIPFLIVSGEIGEDRAVALMKAGVHDYVTKGNLTRLVPAIEREVREAQTRQARRTAEQSLRDSQQRYEALIQSIDGIVWESGVPPGPLIFVSQRAEMILGYPTQRWTDNAHFWLENIHPEDRQWVAESYRNAIARGNSFQLEYRRQTAHGQVLWLRDVVSIAQDADGAIMLRGVTFDVTERREVEDERERLLSLTEQRAREMSTIAAISAALRTAVTRQETLRIVMDTLRQLLPLRALSYHPVIDKTIGPSELSIGEWPEDYLTRLESDSEAAMLLTSAFESVVLPPIVGAQMETHGKVIGLPLRAQGNLVGVLWGYYQAYHPDDNASRPLSVSENRLLTALTDIIAAALYRAGLYEETQILARQMEEMMKSTLQGLILLDERGCIILANPAAQHALTLLAPENLSANSPSKAHSHHQTGTPEPLTHLGNHPLPIPTGSTEHGEEIATKPAESRFEVSVETPVARTYEVILRPVDTEFAQQSWLLMLNDVTEERLEQERLQKQNRLAAVGQLAAGIAHDFNNSLGVIRLYTDLVQRHADLSERDRERMHTVSKQIGHATHLIHQILDFSRRSIMERRALDLHELVSDLRAILEHTLGKNIDIDYTHENRPIMIQGDKTRIQQVIFNLVVNARDAMPNGGRITFRLQSYTCTATDEPPLVDLAPGEWAILSITDTGHGIDPELLPQLFEPFFTTKPAGHGTGLGLAQVYGIVKQHDGHVDVKTQPGEGTTFILYFPMEAADKSREDKFAAFSQAKVRGRVLIVEDDPAGREALCETLHAYGYTVSAAENGNDALTRIQAAPQSFDLIISDLVMPNMSGTQLFAHLRERNIITPMIIITGYPLADSGQELLEQGIVDWLTKPFKAEVLLHKIETTLKT